jgi:hypothetical protein
MKINFRRKGIPLAQRDIENFEKTIKVRLPEDYKRFLAEQNGGEKPDAEIFRLATGGSSILSRLFPIGDGKGRDVLGFARQLRDELPVGVIPIGQDIGGNYLCLSTDGLTTGQIFLLNHDESPSRSPAEKWNKLIFCESSFSAFCEGLHG